MLEWYVFYLVFVIGGTWLICRLGMPTHLKEVRLTVDSINEMFDETMRENKAAWDSIKQQLKEK